MAVAGVLTTAEAMRRVFADRIPAPSAADPQAVDSLARLRAGDQTATHDLVWEVLGRLTVAAPAALVAAVDATLEARS